MKQSTAQALPLATWYVLPRPSVCLLVLIGLPVDQGRASRRPWPIQWDMLINIASGEGLLGQPASRASAIGQEPFQGSRNEAGGEAFG